MSELNRANCPWCRRVAEETGGISTRCLEHEDDGKLRNSGPDK